MPYLSSRIQAQTDKSAFDIWKRAKALEAAGVEVVHLEIGEPDFATPDHITAAAKQAIADGQTRYEPSSGTITLRQAIAEYVNGTRSLNIDPTQIVVTPGVQGALFASVMAVIGAGDEILVPNPGYPMYLSMLPFAHGKAVPYPLRPENQFQPDISELRDCITSNTKAILLNSPSNPMGTIFNYESLTQIAHLALEYDLWILSDEIYAQLYFTDTFPRSISTLPEMAERTILMDGCSKAYAMTGWRVGFGVFPHVLVKPIDAWNAHTHSCLPGFIQRAAEVAFNGPQDCVKLMRNTYRQRRDFVIDYLSHYEKIKVIRPDGAFYVMLDVSAITGPNVGPFVDQLLAQGVAVLPGEVMGDMAQGFIRLALNHGEDQLALGLDRFIETLVHMGL